MRLALLLATVLCVTTGTAEAKRFTVVQANVGNINAACRAAKYKLCQPAVAARAKVALRALKADVVGFEELTPDRKQAAQLLGKGFRVSCDSRYGWDCLAVRKASGLEVVKALRTRRAPKGCDDGFTADTGRLAFKGRRITVLLAHPNSTDVACRADQVRDLLSTVPRRGPVLALGDWNLDPYREDDASVTVFDAARRRLHLRLASTRTLSLLAGNSQFSPTGEVLDTSYPYPYPLSKRTIDHVLVRGFRGGCTVRRVDGGGGMDHRAQVCRLSLKR